MADFNSYGARRGNHEVMMRGTFANIRIKNQMLPGIEGGMTSYIPTGEMLPIYDAAMRYKADGTPTRRLRRQGIRHRLVARLGGEGHHAARRARRHRRELRAHPPLQSGGHGRAAAAVHAANRRSRSASRRRDVHVDGVAGIQPRQDVDGRIVTRADGTSRARQGACRIDTANELEYFKHGGILPYVLRQARRLSGVDLAVEIVGWAGAVLILLAYLLLSAGKFSGNSLIYQVDERGRRGRLRRQRLVARCRPLGDAQCFVDDDRVVRLDPHFQSPAKACPMSRVVDLSHRITEGMTTYKGLPGPHICDYWTREHRRPIMTTARPSRSAGSTWSPIPAPISMRLSTDGRMARIWPSSSLTN